MTAQIKMPSVPLLPNVHALADAGFVTGASGRNWDGYGAEIALDPAITNTQKMLLTDPQTSGGLLVSCSADSVDAVLEIFRQGGFAEAAVIGQMVAGPAQVHVTAS